MAKITIGEETFPSKKALSERVRAIVRRGALASEDDILMRELLPRHTEAAQKIGCGVKRIWVAPDQYGGRCFYLERTDGSQTDFSWVHCVNGQPTKDWVLAALREEIAEQIEACKARAFAEANVLICQISGDEIVWQDAHVDHAPPNTFIVLAREFLANEHGELAVGGTGDGEQRAYLIDRSAAERWKSFHLERAKLRIVSAKANLGTLRHDPRY